MMPPRLTLAPDECSAVTKPIGAPKESDIKSPVTTIASQVARRSGGAPPPARA